MAKKPKGKAPTKAKTGKIEWTDHDPTMESQRVVVDQIVADGSSSGGVRLLRADRLEQYAQSKSISIETWADEEEDWIATWRVKAFVGFPSQRPVQEGDVYFVKTASRLHKNYKPIPIEKAREIHLLCSPDESREIARTEIKKEFFLLAAAKDPDEGKRTKEKLVASLEKDFDEIN